MKLKGFNLGILIAILIVISYKVIGLLMPSSREQKEGYTLSLLDLDYYPTRPLKKVTDISFQLYKTSAVEEVTETKLDDYKGKSVVLHFWATWCGPCTIELPHYDSFAKTDGIVNIALCSGDTETFEKAQNFYKKHSIQNLLIALDNRGGLYRAFEIRALPTTVFIDKDGYERGRIVGIVDWRDQKIVKLLINLLQKEHPS